MGNKPTFVMSNNAILFVRGAQTGLKVNIWK